MSPDAGEWMAFAEADFHAAEVLLADAGVPTRIACFHAQQAAEKAIKTILVAEQTVFRRTHDLVVLAALMSVSTRQALGSVDLLALQPWVVDGRYPGDLPDATMDEGEAAVATARILVRAARRRLSPGE